MAQQMRADAEMLHRRFWLDQIENHLGSSIALVEGDSIWDTLPRFDPTLVRKTRFGSSNKAPTSTPAIWSWAPFHLRSSIS